MTQPSHHRSKEERQKMLERVALLHNKRGLTFAVISKRLGVSHSEVGKMFQEWKQEQATQVSKKFVKYFHELTEAEFMRLAKKKPRMTYADLAVAYPQPVWCNYLDAVMGLMGCWSLTSFMVKDKKYCRNCECFIKESGSQSERT